jgi:AraC family transcriptional regulator
VSEQLRKQHRHLHARPNGAACAGYSSAHFSRAFRETFQVTPHAFVLDRRIERATELLARPDHSLLDVAQLTGFQTQQHFSRVFRQRIGISPRAFRHAG